jgi:hypothetical protein
MNPIQKIIEEQRKQSEIHKLSEETINRKLAAREVVQRPEWKEKRGEANRKREWTDESRQKVADLHTGRKRSDATRENISKGRTGIVFSEQQIENMRLAQLDKKHSEETCNLIRSQMYEPARQLRMQQSREDPKNFSTCPHCSKYMINHRYNKHVENCLFLKGPITTYLNDTPQFVYYTEESLVQDGYNIEAIKLVINTNKKHRKMLFVRNASE